MSRHPPHRQLQRLLRRPPERGARDGRGRADRRAHRRLSRRADDDDPAQGSPEGPGRSATRARSCASWRRCAATCMRARHQDRRQRRRPQSGRAAPRRRGRSTSGSGCGRWSRTSRATTCCRQLAALQRAASRFAHLDKGIPLGVAAGAGAERQRLSRRLGHRRGARARRRRGDLPARHRRGARRRTGGVEVRLGARRLGSRSPAASSPATSSSAARSAPAATTPSSTRCRGLDRTRLPDRRDARRRQLRDHQASRAPAGWCRSARSRRSCSTRSAGRATRTPTSRRASTPSALEQEGPDRVLRARRARRAAAADHQGLHQLLRRLQELDDLRARPASTSRPRRALAEETLWKLVGGTRAVRRDAASRCARGDRADPAATRTPSRTCTVAVKDPDAQKVGRALQQQGRRDGARELSRASS